MSLFPTRSSVTELSKGVVAEIHDHLFQASQDGLEYFCPSHRLDTRDWSYLQQRGMADFEAMSMMVSICLSRTAVTVFSATNSPSLTVASLP